MNEVWLFTEEPAYQEGRVIGVFTSPEAAREEWQSEAGRPMPAPNDEGNYRDDHQALYLTRWEITA